MVGGDTRARVVPALAGLMLIVSGLAGCATTPAPAGLPAETRTVTVFAASSLTEAFTDLGRRFEEQNSGSQIVFNFGGSNQLRAQLEQGARADLFASANQIEMDKAVQGGAIDGAAQIFARNRLVVIVPGDNPASITTPADLARPGLRLVLAAPTVPAGDYTRRALQAMGQDPAYGGDFPERVRGNLVSEETNVKQVVAKVQLGEADAGVVYATDARAVKSGGVRTIDIPDAVNQVAAYPLAVVQGAAQPELARRFVDFVLSDPGQQVLAGYGFAPGR